MGEGADFTGVIDLVTQKAMRWDKTDLGQTYIEAEIPTEFQDEVAQARETLYETVAVEDEALLEKYLGGEEITHVELRTAIRAATLQGRLFPVFCGSSLKNQGVQPLLDAVVDFLPSPVDVPPIEGTVPHPASGGERSKRAKKVAEAQHIVTRLANDTAPFSALAFKVASHPTVDKLVYCRIYSGVLKRGEAIYNVRSEKRERIKSYPTDARQ